MRDRDKARGERARLRHRSSASDRPTRSLALIALSLLTMLAIADQPAKPSDQQSETNLNTVTVEAQRPTLERQASAFVSAIAMKRFDDSLARWEEPIEMCPSVFKLPRNEGEYILACLSRIALDGGEPLGPDRRTRCECPGRISRRSSDSVLHDHPCCDVLSDYFVASAGVKYSIFSFVAI